MTPTLKRKSDEMAEPTTPEACDTPAPKRMRITQTQKQALIDNLQLEITERARQLRAQYALQCAGLRSRIERRINRIPMSMRSITMQDLMEKHMLKPAPPPKQEPVRPTVAAKPYAAMPAPTRAARKKKSDIVIAADPPQAQEGSSNDVHLSSTLPAMATAPKSNPKGAKRPGSRTGKGAEGVLSPRSHNSRTLPRSPIKGATTSSSIDCQPPVPASPSKPHINRPLSPLKPTSPLKSAAMATTSAISSSVHTMLSTAKSTATRSGKASGATVASTRSQAQTTRTVSQASNHSVATNGTTTSSGTVIKSNNTRSVRGRTAAATTSKKTTTTTAKATTTAAAAAPKTKSGTTTRKATTAATTTKKTIAAAAAVAATSETTPTATTGRRVLRKRNPV